MREPIMERYPKQKEINRRITRGVPPPLIHCIVLKRSEGRVWSAIGAPLLVVSVPGVLMCQVHRSPVKQERRECL